MEFYGRLIDWSKSSDGNSPTSLHDWCKLEIAIELSCILQDGTDHLENRENALIVRLSSTQLKIWGILLLKPCGDVDLKG